MRLLVLVAVSLAVVALLPVASAGCTTAYAGATSTNAGPTLGLVLWWASNPAVNTPGFLAGLPVVLPPLPPAQVASTTAYVACVV